MAPRKFWVLHPPLMVTPIPKGAVELKADPKAIRETLRRQREQRGVKVSQSKLP